MAFFTVYLDDSGTAPEHLIASASALIIPGKQILTLEDNWNRFVEKRGIKDFHASPCAAAPKCNEEQYRHLTERDKNHIFMRVRQFCKKYGVQTFGFSVYKDHFDSIISTVNEEFRAYVGNHYTFAVRHVLRDIEKWRRQRRIEEPLQYIFDWQAIGSDCREEVDDLIGQMCEHYDEKVQHDFKNRRTVPGLQCVDLIAWLTLQLGMNHFRGKLMEGLSSECIRDFENYYPAGYKRSPNEKWFQVATVPETNMRMWFKAEMKFGKSIPWFKDWYGRHPNREVLLHARKKRIQEVLASSEATGNSSP
ncbi:MAG: DUF3800 domain-containing protein [Acidipila sp.]|nr:DUF3800 domain-containing protein [Acidipila sp.]